MYAKYQGRRYKPVKPTGDCSEFENHWRLVLYHDKHETKLFWVEPGDIVSGWVVGITLV